MSSSAQTEQNTFSGLPKGTVVDGRYRITGFIGSGGFARVYEAQHVMTDNTVALKVLDPRANDTDGTFVERFMREARIAASLQHPNVVRIYDYGQAVGGYPYMAMELLRGHDLGCEIGLNGPLDPARVYKLFMPVIEALAHGHDRSIIHKDLKPANLFLNRAGTPEENLIVLDFGVARVDAGEVARLTDTGQLLGTPRYLAPEYIKEQKVAPGIDVYQVALIISETLAAYPAVDGNPYTSMMRHCNGDLRVPDVLKGGRIGDWFARATATELPNRYPNCGEFGAELRAIADEFCALPKQPRPVEEYSTARRTISTDNGALSTGNGISLGPSTDSMPMSGTDPGVNPVALLGDSSPPYLLSDPHISAQGHAASGNNRGGLVVLLMLLVLIAGGTLAFVMLNRDDKPTDDAETGAAEAAEAPEAPANAADADVQVAIIFVASEPSGAEIYLSGFEAGTTPARLEVEIGTTPELSLELDGYQRWAQELEVPDDIEQKIAAKLEPVVPEPDPVAEPEPTKPELNAGTANKGTRPNTGRNNGKTDRGKEKPDRGGSGSGSGSSSGGGFVVAP